MKKTIIFTLISTLIIGCQLTDNYITPPKPTPQVQDTKYCVLAEKRLLELGCEEGLPLKDGTGFAKFCEDTQSNGIFLNPKCLSEIKSCEEVNVCTSSK